ncbi:MAG: hypothetical protein IT324_05250 [Anaerolineae bacterium]|nr:hypothetical protein [Anaerolineae bacterium]
MRLIKQNGITKIAAQTYTLTCASDRPFIDLDDPDGNKLASLFVLSSVHPLDGRDETVQIGAWQADETAGEIVLSLTAESTSWTRKTYRFRCQPRRFIYEIEIEGQGQLAEVNYFGGYYSGQPRWGSGFFWSGQSFWRGFNPEPTSDEDYYFAPSGGSAIDISGVPLPGKASWFFTPPPYCFAFEGKNTWLTMGVEAAPGENRYTDYWYRGQQSCFFLALSYEGHTTINGQYRLPGVGFDFGTNPYEAISQHVQALKDQGYVHLAARDHKPRWWYEPIFCGWGSQCYVAAVQGGRASDCARQALYEEFLRTLEAHGVVPGIVALDDKWQTTYGENTVDPAKWPDLKGFIDRQHAAERKILLWLKAWDAEGIPSEECVTNAIGLPVTVDPTNPAFERRLRKSIRNMLSPDGYGADGFKIDFTARIPNGPGLRSHGDVWGLELMKRYLGIIYDEAKRTKPDALIMAHSPHPYLADVVDVIRLNDINTGKDVNNAMQHRARIASIACPDAIIDTDNWPITDRSVWRDYVRIQPKLGVPSLYYTDHIDTTREPLEALDYELIREAWALHRSRIPEM